MRKRRRQSTAPPGMCARCRVKPARVKDTYCHDCRIAYQREYRRRKRRERND